MAKGDKFYFDNFTACASLCKDAAVLLVECLENYDTEKIEDMLEKMHVLEHSADIQKHYMSDALARAFVTPLDREDLDMLSGQLDNVADTIEEILQKIYIFNLRQVPPPAIEFAKKLVDLCQMLFQMMSEFENYKRSKTLSSLIISCNDVEEECDRLYLTTMRNLTENYSDPMQAIALYKIFDCFEACADACEHVADTIETIVMKNT